MRLFLLLNDTVDVTALDHVLTDISQSIRSYKTIITKSTVPPGTNEKIEEDLIASGVSQSMFAVVSNPEFLREGNALYDMLHPDKTVIGVKKGDDVSVGIVQSIYKHIEAPYIITSLTGAELIKYASNYFLAAKISFINEMARICKEHFETLHHKKAAVLGISFKPNTDDIRNSQAVRLMERLIQLGCDVHAYDPEAEIPPRCKTR